jgi:sulfur transfer complex TusBCD TusB component (DsrH family)
MAEKVLTIFEKPIYLSYEPVDPHLFATALGVADTPVEANILLRDAAITYAVTGQNCTGAKVAGLDVMAEDTSPAKLIEFMLSHGSKIYAVEEDMKARGISADQLVRGVKSIKESETVNLIEEHEAVLVW